MKRGKAIALFTGAGVIGIVVVALVFSKNLVIQYHVYRLRIDPDYLREIIQEDEESPEHEAIHAYLETQKGQNQFLDLYLSTIEERIKEAASRTLVQGAVVVFDNRWMIGLTDDRGGRSSQGLLTSSWQRKLWKSLSSYVSHLAGEEFMSSRYPHLRFAFLSADEVAKRSGFYMSLENGTSGSADSRSRPPDWITKSDLEVYQRSTGLLIERVGP